MKFAFAHVAAGLMVAATARAQQAPTHHASAMNRATGALPVSSIVLRKDGIRTVTVTATDYAFAAPDTIPAG